MLEQHSESLADLFLTPSRGVANSVRISVANVAIDSALVDVSEESVQFDKADFEVLGRTLRNAVRIAESRCGSGRTESGVIS